MASLSSPAILHDIVRAAPGFMLSSCEVIAENILQLVNSLIRLLTNF